MNENTAPSARERRAIQFLGIALVIGIFTAALRAWTWTDVERSRNLIVVAPQFTHISIVDGPPLLDETHGVHTWSVLPGPIFLEVTFPEQEPVTQRTKVVVPKGLGGLMLQVSQTANGELVLGYF
jgi:hypothetical protein